MIGIFDSGSGGLTFLHAARQLMPEYDYIYFWDYENCPYGNRESDEILALTRAGVEKLRDADAKIVILACNTAVANAIRPLQSDASIGVKILGVTIPGAEFVHEQGFHHITVVATASSVKHRLYRERVGILDESVRVDEIGLDNLAMWVEEYLAGSRSREFLVDFLQSQKSLFSPHSEAIVLGCTHYSHIIDIFREVFSHMSIIDPSAEAAKKLRSYLDRHSEIKWLLSQGGSVKMLS